MVKTDFKQLPFSTKIQTILWYIGIAWHNPFRYKKDLHPGECTPDFNCCNKIGRKAWVRIPMKGLKKIKT